MGGRWRVDERQAGTLDLHASSVALLAPGGPGSVGRAVRVLTSTDLALVLGSAQPDAHVDRERAAAAGATVVRRRSGGGAVMVGPGLVVWVDVVVPSDDCLWDADVGRAGWWLGEVWSGALADVGLPGEVWRGAALRSSWSDRVCFAGLGAGEVTIGGRKVLGVSQRRTRAGTLFQCAVPVEWDPALLVDVLRWPPGDAERGAAVLARAATGIGADRAAPLVAAFLDRLP